MSATEKTSDGAVHAADEHDAPITPADFRVISGNPTPQELAAVTVVLGAMLDEADTAPPAAPPAPDAWARSQRSLRAPHLSGTWQHSLR